MARRDKRVVILMSEEEYAELKGRAGIASIGAYIRERLMETDDERELRLHPTKVIEHGKAEEGRAEGLRRGKDVLGMEGVSVAGERDLSAEARKGRIAKNQCGEAVGPGMYCSKCDRRHE